MKTKYGQRQQTQQAPQPWNGKYTLQCSGDVKNVIIFQLKTKAFIMQVQEQ